MKKTTNVVIQEFRTLWRAKLRLRGQQKSSHEFLFRAGEDFVVASAMAQKLLEGSTAADITGAEVVALDRVAHLWN